MWEETRSNSQVKQSSANVRPQEPQEVSAERDQRSDRKEP